MASQRPQWPDILDPAFRKVYGDEIRQLAPVGMTIFNVDTSVKNIEKDTSATGLSKLTQLSEGSAITYEDPVEGYNVTYTHRKFGVGTSISQELFEDDQFGVMRHVQAAPRGVGGNVIPSAVAGDGNALNHVVCRCRG